MGVDISRYPAEADAYRRTRLMAQHDVDVVLDVGANEGQYASELRRLGYRGAIVSFEPLKAPFGIARCAAADDPAWTVLPCALGDQTGKATLNIAGNRGASSSILPMLDAHRAAAPDAAYIDTVEVAVYRLDDLFPYVVPEATAPYLKVDVQGFELQVLDGAADILTRCVGLQIELSFLPLYDGQILYREAIDMITERGFDLMSIEPGFTDLTSGRMLQADGIFFRR